MFDMMAFGIEYNWMLLLEDTANDNIKNEEFIYIHELNKFKLGLCVHWANTMQNIVVVVPDDIEPSPHCEEDSIRTTIYVLFSIIPR